MVGKKFSNAVLFALLSQHRADGDVAPRDLVQSVASSFRLGRSHGNKISKGRECIFKPRRTKLYQNKDRFHSKSTEPDVGILSLSASPKKLRPTETRRPWMKNRPIKKASLNEESSTAPDVGILTSSKTSSSCFGQNEVCQADPTSSLGGCCVSSTGTAYRPRPKLQGRMKGIQVSKRSLQMQDVFPTPSSSAPVGEYDSENDASCPITCNDPSFCDCFIEGSGDASCTSIIATGCRNGNYVQCTPPEYLDLVTNYYCIYYKCKDEGKSQLTCDCEVNTAACEFCKETSANDLANCKFGDGTYDAADFCGPAYCCASATDDAERQLCFEDDGGYGQGGYSPDDTAPTVAAAPPSRFPTAGPASSTAFPTPEPASSNSACPSACNDPSFCTCFNEDGGDSFTPDDCISIFASACRTGDFVDCIPPAYLELANNYYCDYYKCRDEGKDQFTCGCEAYSVACEFCRENLEANLTSCMFGEGQYNVTELCGPADCCAAATNDAERQRCFASYDIYTPPTPSYVSPTYACPSTCTDDSFCACISDSGDDCIPVKAAACRSGSFESCLDSYYIPRFTHYYCPYYECLDSGEGSRTYGACFCAAFTGVCDYCRENSPDDLASCSLRQYAGYNGESACHVADCCVNEQSEYNKAWCITHASGFYENVTDSNQSPSAVVEYCGPSCTDPDLCSCLFGSGTALGLDCPNVITSSCASGEITSCFQNETTARYQICPFYECIDSGHAYDSGECTCAIFTSMCDFCKRNFADDIANCDTDTPYMTYYYGDHALCSVAECCSNAATDQDKLLCTDINRTAVEISNGTEPVDGVVDEETTPTKPTATEMPIETDNVADDETIPTNETETEMPIEEEPVDSLAGDKTGIDHGLAGNETLSLNKTDAEKDTEQTPPGESALNETLDNIGEPTGTDQDEAGANEPDTPSGASIKSIWGAFWIASLALGVSFHMRF